MISIDQALILSNLLIVMTSDYVIVTVVKASKMVRPRKDKAPDKAGE